MRRVGGHCVGLSGKSVWRRRFLHLPNGARHVRLPVCGRLLQVRHLRFRRDLELAQARSSQGVLLVDRRQSRIVAGGRERSWPGREAVYLLLLDVRSGCRRRRPARRMVRSPSGIMGRGRALVRFGETGHGIVRERARRRRQARGSSLCSVARPRRPCCSSRDRRKRVVCREVRGETLPSTLRRLWPRFADDAVESRTVAANEETGGMAARAILVRSERRACKNGAHWKTM